MARAGLVVVVVALVVMAAAVCQARYLPTRADDSRLDEIRELLRELMERTAESSVGGGSSSSTGRMAYDKRFLFKRAAPVGGADEVVEPLLSLPQ